MNKSNFHVGNSKELDESETEWPTVNVRSKTDKLDLPIYMLKHTFPRENFLECLIDRVSQASKISTRRVYVILVNFQGLARILVVMQNNEPNSFGFPGGRLSVDINKCPMKNGGIHEWSGKKCTVCGCPNFYANKDSTNWRIEVVKQTKEWVKNNVQNIKKHCSEDEKASAVRIFKEETGMNFMNEEIIGRANVLSFGMTKFYICRGTFENTEQPSPNTNSVLSAHFMGFSQINDLITKGKMSAIHSRAFENYQTHPL